MVRLPFFEDTVVRANASRGFQAPPLLWKYFEDTAPGFSVNNPDIKAERAWVYEAGVESQLSERLWAKFGAYRSDVTDGIVTALTPEGRFIKRNVSKFRQRGFELESRLNVAQGADVSFAGLFNDVEDKATGLKVTGRGVTRPSFRLGLDLAFPNGSTAGVWGNYDRWDSPAVGQANDRKFIFTARVSHTFKRVLGVSDATVFVTAYNLTNSKYWNNIDFPYPERYFEGGVSFDF